MKTKWYLVICLAKSCQIWNSNGTRQLAFIESKKKLSEGRISFFLSAATGYEAESGNEFIAVGTSNGEIHYVDINGA